MLMIGCGHDQGAEEVATQGWAEDPHRGTPARWRVAWHPKALDEKDRQRQLAERLGVHQSDVARMETGEHTPSLERLVRVAGGLDIEQMIDIRPEKKKAQLPKKRALAAGSFAVGGCEIVLATA